MSSIIVPRASPVSSMRKSLLKWGVGSHKIGVGPTETPSPSPPASPRTILIDLPAEYVVGGFVDIQDDIVLSVDPSIAVLLANPSRLQEVVGKSITHFALCCWEGDRSAMSAFSDMAAGSRDRCRTPSVVSGKQLEWTAFKSRERVNSYVLLATVRKRQERAALSLAMASSNETSPSANGSAVATGCYLNQTVLDKEFNLRLEAKLAVQRQRIDELEKEKEQALRNNLLEQETGGLKSDLLKVRNQRLEAELKVVEEGNMRLEAEQVVQSTRIGELENKKGASSEKRCCTCKKGLESYLLKERNQELEKEKEKAQKNDHFEHEKRRLESNLLKERNQRLEAESKFIEERNLRLEAEQVVQNKWIDGLEKEKEQARRNDLQRESDLLKERNQRLEAESNVTEERNKRLEAEQVLQSKWIDELEKEKEQALRNDLQRESDLLKERNQRLEAEIHADSHLNHTLKVCIYLRFSAEEVYLPQRPHCACFLTSPRI
jgi:hypothetical protein